MCVWVNCVGRITHCIVGCCAVVNSIQKYRLCMGASIIRDTDRLENLLHKQNKSALTTSLGKQRGSRREQEEEKLRVRKRKIDAGLFLLSALCGCEKLCCSVVDGVVVIQQAFPVKYLLCSLCAVFCSPSAGLAKTQLFNEHIDQCFSHLHFPHREAERERQKGEERERGKKALEKLLTHKVGLFF